MLGTSQTRRFPKKRPVKASVKASQYTYVKGQLTTVRALSQRRFDRDFDREALLTSNDSYNLIPTLKVFMYNMADEVPKPARWGQSQVSGGGELNTTRAAPYYYYYYHGGWRGTAQQPTGIGAAGV